MKIRPLFVALPVSLVAAAGFAFATIGTANAVNGGAEIAQAQPAPAPSTGPAAGPNAGPEVRTFSPRNMCLNQTAKRIGQRAYLKARLDLKPEQMNQWNAFEKASDEASAKQKARCATLPAEVKMPVSLTDRLNMQEDAMKARLEAIQAVKPSLTALYASLTPEQKEIMERSGRGGRHMGRHGHRHHR
jgi:hypothetical protein